MLCAVGGHWFDSPLHQIYHPRAMGQSRCTTAVQIFLCGWWALATGCDRQSASVSNPTTVPETRANVASLVPAATDLILGMGAADHLVAVSNYDPAEIEGRVLPRVGDYMGPAWEMIATLRPRVMIIQMSPDRLPAGFTQKVDRLGIQLLNVRLNTLADVLAAIPQIGTAIGENDKASQLAKRLSDRLKTVREQSAGLPRIKTLLTLDETGETLAGPGTLLDDLLVAAGGENGAASLGGSWPKADSETLIKLQPQAVILLKPGGNVGTLAAAKTAWGRLPNIPAAKEGRIYLIATPSVLLPGAHVADIAEEMFRDLHEGGAVH